MSTSRIYQNIVLQSHDVVTLDDRASHHLLHVLRIKSGSRITLFNGDGQEYTALVEVQKKDIQATVLSVQQIKREPPVQVTLVQGISRGDHMDWTIQKAVELGVHTIVPVLCERSMRLSDGTRTHKKYLHWHNVLISACEQSGRCVLPELQPIQPLDKYLADAINIQAFVLDPNAERSLKQSLNQTNSAILLIGPEGGLGEHEIKTANSAGYQSVNLGPRILRTETAGVAALSIIQAELGDLK